MRPSEPQPRFVVCVKNKDYPASLELRKLYQVVADPAAAKHHQLRVIDESGEDYLYPDERDDTEGPTLRTERGKDRVPSGLGPPPHFSQTR